MELLSFSGHEHETIELKHRIDFLYNVATDNFLFKPGGCMRSLLGDVVRELNSVQLRLQVNRCAARRSSLQETETKTCLRWLQYHYSFSFLPICPRDM